MTCPECTLARERAWHGIYIVACYGCRARGLARSQAAQQAVATRSAAALAEAVAAAMPSMPLAEAMQEVWDWWRVDHQSEKQSEGTAA
jgi:hypothetical protein